MPGAGCAETPAAELRARVGAVLVGEACVIGGQYRRKLGAMVFRAADEVVGSTSRQASGCRSRWCAGRAGAGCARSLGNGNRATRAPRPWAATSPIDRFRTLARVRHPVLRLRASVVARPAVLAAIAIAPAFAVGACGGGGAERPTRSDAVRAAVRGYLGALAAHHWTQACRLMTPDARRRLVDEAGASCADALAAGGAAADELASAQREVAGADVRVQGATASLGPLGTAQQSMRLRRVGGRWLIAG